MPTPFPHQLTGARFLADRRAALLADAPRVGKTGAAILACDFVFARTVLVVTTATGRANWEREFREWQAYPRKVQAIYRTDERIDLTNEVVVIAWSVVAEEKIHGQLVARQWNVLILDESHYAKADDARRAQAVYGSKRGLHKTADVIWCLTGTPIPNAPDDLWPMLYALAPKRLGEFRKLADFRARYCVVQLRNVGGRVVEVVRAGKNLKELQQRLDGFWLRRTQTDVGIRPPIFSLFSIAAGATPGFDEREAEILEAAENGDTASLEIHLGTLRRLTGVTKALGVAEAVREEFATGLDKIVLMAWHKDTLAVLRKELSEYGVVGIDGSTPANKRQAEVDEFQHGKARVFAGQILAAGENIDLSAASNLWFVEPSFVPKDMAQAALRITNINQKRQCYVRVAALAGSIDEAVMAILTRKVSTIREVMTHAS